MDDNLSELKKIINTIVRHDPNTPIDTLLKDKFNDFEKISVNTISIYEYTEKNHIYLVKFNNIEYIIELSQLEEWLPSGHLHYTDLHLINIRTKEECHKPMEVFQFTEHGYTFSIIKDINNNYSFKDITGT